MTREELVARCRSILRNDPWDDNAVENSADELAELLWPLYDPNAWAQCGTGKPPVHPNAEPEDTTADRFWRA